MPNVPNVPNVENSAEPFQRRWLKAGGSLSNINDNAEGRKKASSPSGPCEATVNTCRDDQGGEVAWWHQIKGAAVLHDDDTATRAALLFDAGPAPEHVP